MPQNLYLDECTSVLLRDRLRLHDLQSAQFLTVEHASQRVRGQSDPQQLKYAVETKALFVTHNIRDFYWLHRWWKTLLAWGLLTTPHSGILAVPNSLRIDVAATAVFTFLTQRPAPQLENNMYVFKQNQWSRENW